MSLAQIQDVLARLYTDTNLREAFLKDPAQVGASLGLSSAETHQLASIAEKQIVQFADSLHRKRADEVRVLLPFTRRALATRFDELFAAHAKRYCPSGVRKHRDDAVEFVSSLEQDSFSREIPGWVTDVARFEQTQLKIRDGEVTARIQYFRHDLRPLFRAWKSSESVENVPYRPSLAFWIRARSFARQFFVPMPQPLKTLRSVLRTG